MKEDSVGVASFHQDLYNYFADGKRMERKEGKGVC